MNKQPKCIIVTGRPGAGKTTLAKKLSAELWMPVISRDEIKEGYVNTYGVKHDQLPSDTNSIVSDIFFAIVRQHLSSKVSVVIEAAFQHEVWARRFDAIRDVSIPLIVVCSIDETMAAKRHLNRGLDNPCREFFHGDKRVTIYRETGALAPPGSYAVPNLDAPTIEVSTEGTYAPSIDDIISWIQTADRDSTSA